MPDEKGETEADEEQMPSTSLHAHESGIEEENARPRRGQHRGRPARRRRERGLGGDQYRRFDVRRAAAGGRGRGPLERVTHRRAAAVHAARHSYQAYWTTCAVRRRRGRRGAPSAQLRPRRRSADRGRPGHPARRRCPRPHRFRDCPSAWLLRRPPCRRRRCRACSGPARRLRVHRLLLRGLPAASDRVPGGRGHKRRAPARSGYLPGRGLDQ